MGSELQGDMNLATLVNAVELELGVSGEDCIRLAKGGRALQDSDGAKLLRELGIYEGVQLAAKLEVRNKGACPACRREFHVHRGVSINVIRGKITCNCSHCGLFIGPRSKVNVCMKCKC